jgi:hypothetical protein
VRQVELGRREDERVAEHRLATHAVHLRRACFIKRNKTSRLV